jgi:hypothetical protein
MRPLLVIKLAVLLVYCRFLTFAPVRIWTSWLRFSRVDVLERRPVGGDLPSELWMIPGYIERLSRFAPWSNRCLPAAVATAIELRNRGLPSLLVLGVRWLGTGEHTLGRRIDAHAWLYVGAKVVCGRQGVNGHQVMVAWRI